MTSSEDSISRTSENVSCSSGKSLRAWMTLLAVVIAGIALDLGSKAWAFRNETINRESILADGHWRPAFDSTVELLPWRLLDLQLVLNFGAVFGFGEHQRFFFIAFTIAALLVGLIVFARMTRRHQTLAHVAIGMVLAGGVGNLYDRITLGAVRDFLHMLPRRHMPLNWTWPGSNNPEMFPWVFNFADMMLLFGMAMLLTHMRRMELQRRTLATEKLAATTP